MDLAKPVRVLLPQNVHDFLKKGHDFEDVLLQNYTFSFQHYPKKESGRRDCHEFFASRLLLTLTDLKRAIEGNDLSKVIKYSSQLQLTLATRVGFSRVLAGLDKESDDDEATNPQTIADFENMLSEFERDEEGSFHELLEVRGKNGKPQTLIEDLRKMCSGQACLKNSFGNIIVNSGKSTVIGGRLPTISVSCEAAKLLGVWDHEVSSPNGDLQNAELLEMVQRGPYGDGGAWTLHLRYNEAVHVQENLAPGEARGWLHQKLTEHLATQLQKSFGAATQHCRGEAFKMARAFVEGAPFQEVLEGFSSPLATWLKEHPEEQPPSRSLVTAVQRHARTLDPMLAVRHPITQPVPLYQLMVDATKSGFALAMPPQFGNLSELDYDGDKMKIAAERSAKRRLLLEQCLSVPKLQHSALGRRVVTLSGVAPLALNLAQQNGVSGLDFAALLQPRRGSVLWRGVLETVYSPVYFFDELCALGLAMPELLALRWSRPCFEEVRFRALARDGSWLSSRRLAVSHDGYYPVPSEWTAASKCAWIRADLERHEDRFPELQWPLELVLEAGARRSALDGLTFAQMRSLTQVFTAKNFAAEELTVPHLPGLVEEGSFCAFAVPPPCPWRRMARVLLSLARGAPKVCVLGHAAVVTEMLYYSWRPSEADVAYCLLGADYEAKRVGGLALPELPQALQSRDGILDLAVHHQGLEARGFLKEAQVLRRFAFEPPLVERELLERPFDVAAAKALWQQLNLSELRCLCAEPLPQVDESLDFRLFKESRFEEQVDESGWKRSLVVEKRPMREEDWQSLALVAHEVGRLRTRGRGALRPETLLEEPCSDDFDPLLHVRDWCRFVGAVQTPERQAWDVEESLEALATLSNDDFEHCSVLSALEVLGHLLANLLNQPTQSQVAMEEDAYMMAANLGLEEAKARIYGMAENTGESFADVRLKVLDVLQSVSLALSDGHHNGNLHLVRVVAGLLAVDWSLEADTVQLKLEGEERWTRFSACVCEKRLPGGEDSRFSCWKVVWAGEALTPLDHELLYSAAAQRECLLQFDFPVGWEEALRLSGLRGTVSPIKPARWRRLLETSLAEGAVERGVPSRDFGVDLFSWDYQLYAEGERRLVPLMDKRECGERTWCFVDENFAVRPLFEAKACLPPSDETCRAGPDARLPKALALLRGSPERLQLNRLAHSKQLGEGVPLMEAGVPFLVGNTAAPRRGDKKAASTILRMPVFGARYGVRSRMDQPLGGEEISAACVGAARNSVVSSLEMDGRRARQGNNQKEVTALWNKRATLKAGKAVLSPSGHVYGPPLYDGRCRKLGSSSKYPCMGLLTKKFECKSCKTAYVEGDGGGRGMRELVRRKRLLEDPGPLLVSKKMRLKRFAPANHAILRGQRCLDIMEALQASQLEDVEASETVLPEDCRLSRDGEGASAYPMEVVYFLGKHGRLQASKAEQRRAGVPELDAADGRRGFERVGGLRGLGVVSGLGVVRGLGFEGLGVVRGLGVLSGLSSGLQVDASSRPLRPGGEVQGGEGRGALHGSRERRSLGGDRVETTPREAEDSPSFFGGKRGGARRQHEPRGLQRGERAQRALRQRQRTRRGADQARMLGAAGESSRDGHARAGGGAEGARGLRRSFSGGRAERVRRLPRQADRFPPRGLGLRGGVGGREGLPWAGFLGAVRGFLGRALSLRRGFHAGSPEKRLGG
jgi:hypothetical protein